MTVASLPVARMLAVELTKLYSSKTIKKSMQSFILFGPKLFFDVPFSIWQSHDPKVKIHYSGNKTHNAMASNVDASYQEVKENHV